MNVIKQIFSQNTHWQINKDFARQFGLDCAILISDLIDKQIYFDNKNELDKEGYFFNTSENIENDTTLSRFKQNKALNILKKYGFIITDNNTIGNKPRFKIVDSQVLNFFNDSFKETSKLGFKKFKSSYNNNKYNKNKERDARMREDKNSDWTNKAKRRSSYHSTPNHIQTKNQSLKDPKETKEKGSAQKENKEEIGAFQWLRQNYPSRYEQGFAMPYKSQMDKLPKAQHEKFIEDFNDTVIIEELKWDSRIILSRLKKYARNWIQNHNKPNKNKSNNKPL